jgi:transposase
LSPFTDNDVKMAEIFEIQQASQMLGNRISGLKNPYFSDPSLKRAGAGTHHVILPRKRGIPSYWSPKSGPEIPTISAPTQPLQISLGRVAIMYPFQECHRRPRK